MVERFIKSKWQLFFHLALQRDFTVFEEQLRPFDGETVHELLIFATQQTQDVWSSIQRSQRHTVTGKHSNLEQLLNDHDACVAIVKRLAHRVQQISLDVE